MGKTDDNSPASELDVCMESFTSETTVISEFDPSDMDLSIRVNVRYVAPPDSKIQDALQLFRSPNWVQFIVRYIMPQLNSASPASSSVLKSLRRGICTEAGQDNCVICMDKMNKTVKLACGHSFHPGCIFPWLKMHSTCPTCRHQLPTDANSIYTVHAINTTIVLQENQARVPTEELLEMSAGNQTIQAVVNARVRRNNRATSIEPELNSSVAQPRRRSRRRRREETEVRQTKRVRSSVRQVDGSTAA